MNIALIKDGLCNNVTVFKSVEEAIGMLGEEYDFIMECPVNRGVGHRYIDNIWYNQQPVKKIDGTYPYVQDICVKAGDLVCGLNNNIYEALADVDFQQAPPEELTTLYKEVK